jgi:hypothetical protein
VRVLYIGGNDSVGGIHGLTHHRAMDDEALFCVSKNKYCATVLFRITVYEFGIRTNAPTGRLHVEAITGSLPMTPHGIE